MRKTQSSANRIPSNTKHLNPSQLNNNNLEYFLNSYIKSHILYHMKIQPQANLQMDESGLIHHVFMNISEGDDATYHTQKQNYKTLFNTMNKQDNSHSKEEEEYSNYLKQYQTMVKCSRKRQYTSPEHKNKEMNLLIHQFLSDMDSPTSTTTKNNKGEKTATATKTNQTKVRVQKINLNNFSINKNTNNQEGKGKVNKDKSKEKTPRFININELKPKKSEKAIKQKQKLQIEVKVKNITNKPRNISPQIGKKYETVEAPIMLQTFNPINQKQLNQDGYSSSYLKNKQIKESNKHPVEAQKKVKNEKKPLKIQIQIPVQQLNPAQQPEQLQKDNITDLDNQRQKIIKQISHTVFNLLHKTNRISNKPT